jgi:serine protease Do
MMLTLLLATICQVRDDSETYRKAIDSVVYITTVNTEWDAHNGTGVVVAPGLILTAYHVVRPDKLVWAQFPRRKDGAILNEVQHYQTTEYIIRCTVIKSDPKRDLALLRMKAPDPHKPLPLAAKSAEPGESLFTIGNSPAVLWRYSGGNVRQVYADRMEFPSKQAVACTVLEMTCPINAGDSGGPILNRRGELVGIISCVVPGDNALNKGIDLSEIKEFLKDVKP